MVPQLERLAAASELPNVSVRVLAFTAGLHRGILSGPFVMLRFPVNSNGQETEPPTVYVESFTGALYLDKPHEVERYDAAFANIWGASLDETASKDLITRVAGSWKVSTDLSGATWRKSSRSNGERECVEVAGLDGGHRAVRDSKDPAGPVLIVTPAQWAAFTAAARSGDFS